MSRSYKLDIHARVDDLDPLDDNVDVYVSGADRSEWFACFFTPANVSRLLVRWKESGECAGGSYFWVAGAIIVPLLDRESIGRAIDALLEAGEFERALVRCGP